MKDLITFLAAYQPQYAEVARGYPDARIDELERALGRPLPPAYREFLATAAANLGFLVDQVTFEIDEILQLIELKGEAMPAHLCPIAVEEQPGVDYYLDTSRARFAGDGMVVSSAAGSLSFADLRPEYSSLRDMLFSKGFRAVRMLTLPHRQWVDWPPEDFADPLQAPRRDELDRLLQQQGLRKLAVTSDACPLYERGDCASIVVQMMRFPNFVVLLAADQPQTVALVAETLSDGMRGHGSRGSW